MLVSGCLFKAGQRVPEASVRTCLQAVRRSHSPFTIFSSSPSSSPLRTGVGVVGLLRFLGCAGFDDAIAEGESFVRLSTLETIGAAGAPSRSSSPSPEPEPSYPLSVVVSSSPSLPSSPSSPALTASLRSLVVARSLFASRSLLAWSMASASLLEYPWIPIKWRCHFDGGLHGNLHVDPLNFSPHVPLRHVSELAPACAGVSP